MPSLEDLIHLILCCFKTSLRKKATHKTFEIKKDMMGKGREIWKMLEIHLQVLEPEMTADIDTPKNTHPSLSVSMLL